MAVGLPLKTTYADGDVYSASDVNDTNGTVNLVGQTQNFYAAKNKIINGNFANWQRGTSFTVGAGFAYTTDRFGASINGTGVCTISRQTFTPGTAPVAGYEGEFFLRSSKTIGTANTYGGLVNTRIEDVRTLANQTVTLSFWAKADSSTTMGAYLDQNFGSGGSATVSVLGTTTYNLTTSWQRFTTTFTMPSISGKTIGTSSYLDLGFLKFSAAAYVVDMWGVQLEAGSAATAFQTATGTIQGELAACQRYFTTSYDIGVAPASNSSNGAISFSPLTTSTYPWFPSTTFKSTMRVAPSVTAYNPVTGSTSQPVRNGNANTNHPMYILNIGCNGFVSYVDNSSIGGGNSIYFHYTASAEL